MFFFRGRFPFCVGSCSFPVFLVFFCLPSALGSCFGFILLSSWVVLLCCLRFRLVLIVALQLAVWSANLPRAGHLKLESLDWRNIAKHQTRHGKQKKPRSNTKKHHPQTVQKKRKNNRKKKQKNTKKIQNRNTKKTEKKRETIKIHNPGLWLVKHLIKPAISIWHSSGVLVGMVFFRTCFFCNEGTHLPLWPRSF